LNTETTPGPATTTAENRFALLREGNFRRIWLVGGMTMALQWLEMLAGSIFVFSVTQSGFAVTLVTLARAMPLVLFSAVVGALAERISRRNLLIAGYSMLVVTTATLGTLALFDAVTPVMVGIGMFLTGTVFSLEFPIRRNLLGEFAGMDRIGTAMGLDSVLRNGMRIVGPLAGGTLMELVGLEGAYFLATASYVFIVFSLVRVDNPRSPAEGQRPSLMTTIVEGIRFARNDKAVMGFFFVTVIMNIWAFPYMAMVPVIGQERLGLSELPIGMLVAAEGFGGLLGALFIATRGAGLSWAFRKLYFFGACVFMAAIVCFSQSLWFEASLIIVFVGGLGVAGFSTMQGTLPFVIAPPEMRARVLGLLSMCVGMGPIGILHLGIMVTLVGPVWATTIIGVEGLLAMLALYLWNRQVR
jgi:hypothetical protein